MKITATANVKDVIAGLKELRESAVPGVLTQALNRTGATVRTVTVRALQDEMQLRSQKELRALITVTKASKGNLRVTVSVRSKALGIELSTRTIVKQTRRGKGSSKRKVWSITYKGEQVEQGFGPSNLPQFGGKGIFVPVAGGGRNSRGNRKMSHALTFTTVLEMVHAKIDETQEKIGLERFAIELDRALSNALRRLRLQG